MFHSHKPLMYSHTEVCVQHLSRNSHARTTVEVNSNWFYLIVQSIELATKPLYSGTYTGVRGLKKVCAVDRNTFPIDDPPVVFNVEIRK